MPSDIHSFNITYPIHRSYGKLKTASPGSYPEIKGTHPDVRYFVFTEL